MQKDPPQNGRSFYFLQAYAEQVQEAIVNGQSLQVLIKWLKDHAL